MGLLSDGNVSCYARCKTPIVPSNTRKKKGVARHPNTNTLTKLTHSTPGNRRPLVGLAAQLHPLKKPKKAQGDGNEGGGKEVDSEGI